MKTGKSKKQLFAFSVPIGSFLNISEKVVISWKDINSRYYGFNDVLGEFSGISTSNANGKQYEDVISNIEQADILRQHDQETMTAKATKLFIEGYKLKNTEISNWLRIETPLYNNVKKMVGVFSLSFPSNKLNFFSILKIINNNLDSFPLMMMLLNNNAKYRLTNRQNECLCHIIRGRTTKEIAQLLSISPRTVETYLEQIKAELNCYTKSQLINKVWDEGLL